MISIRRERPRDMVGIRAVNEAAFGKRTEADIVDALRAACPDHLSVVVESAGTIVGHILFSPVTVEGGSQYRHGMGLAPMAVMPDRQRQGIGSRLIEAGLEILREQGYSFVIVLGHPEFYPRFGFVPASHHGLRCQWVGVPDEAFMVLVLDEASMAGVTGVARYRGGPGRPSHPWNPRLGGKSLDLVVEQPDMPTIHEAMMDLDGEWQQHLPALREVPPQGQEGDAGIASGVWMVHRSEAHPRDARDEEQVMFVAGGMVRPSLNRGNALRCPRVIGLEVLVVHRIAEGEGLVLEEYRVARIDSLEFKQVTVDQPVT
jgi:putative acetyltransferase